MKDTYKIRIGKHVPSMGRPLVIVTSYKRPHETFFREVLVCFTDSENLKSLRLNLQQPAEDNAPKIDDDLMDESASLYVDRFIDELLEDMSEKWQCFRKHPSHELKEIRPARLEHLLFNKQLPQALLTKMGKSRVQELSELSERLQALSKIEIRTEGFE
jgi:hypothetical protein